MSAVVLIASGDSKRLTRLRKLVESETGVAVPAVDAREAIRLFHLRAPDLVLLYVDSEDDISLELCRDMRMLRGARKRSILVVAAKECRQQAFAAGCDAFIARQTDTRPLEHALRRFIAETRRPRVSGTVEATI